MSRRRVVLIATMALAMLALKRHYSTAAVEDLRWVLGPTSALVALASGSPFEFERGAGYLSRERFLVIEKSCAGLNFMIAALGMIGLRLSRDAASAGAGARVLALSLAVSYVAAVLVNSLRILAAMWLSSADLASGWWTAPRIHRLEGIAVYFGGLVALSLMARALPFGRRPARSGEPS